MISRGQGHLGRIYERLRKRSYRGYRGSKLHAAYVRGLKDGLEAVRTGIKELGE